MNGSGKNLARLIERIGYRDTVPQQNAWQSSFRRPEVVTIEVEVCVRFYFSFFHLLFNRKYMK